MAKFLLEIGSEEIPARFLKNEEKELARLFGEALDSAGLAHGAISVWATPRRAALLVGELAPTQSVKEELVIGPPARIAFGADGKPAKALEGFARSNNAAIEDVFQLDTDKGQYVALRKLCGGKPASELLAAICPDVISALPFGKRMRWGDNEFAYARPLRWILALLDSEIVNFSVGPVSAGRLTFGHRVLGPGPFAVTDAGAYAETVSEKCAIVLDPAQRRQTIVKGGNDLAESRGGKALWKESLLEEVGGLVEHPLPLLGDFDPAYLELPAEVLLTSMESHQKSFGVAGPDGKLLPHFITVLNTSPEDINIVKNGWERVLRARLEDARFFWKSDLAAASFEKWLEKLDHVIFIGPLGSMGEKAARLENLCAWLAEAVEDANPQQAARAGKLAKADLVSGMVGEFDTLQGIMGGIYAEKFGEESPVAQAIREQYLPAGPDSPLPQSTAGAILSLADKADTLAGCFGLDMIPTGAADPNGLRRCALGIIRIVLARGLTLNIRLLFAKARELYGQKQWKLSFDEAQSRLMAFFAGRLRNYFIASGYDTLLVEAALAVAVDNVPACKARLDALVAFSAEPGYEKQVQTFKRVENITKKAELAENEADWREDRLVEHAEKELALNLRRILPELDKNLAAGKYGEALAQLRTLQPAVDAFFDRVMVNCEDQDIRANRLKMLNSIRKRFSAVARFSALQI